MDPGGRVVLFSSLAAGGVGIAAVVADHLLVDTNLLIEALTMSACSVQE